MATASQPKSLFAIYRWLVLQFDDANHYIRPSSNFAYVSSSSANVSAILRRRSTGYVVSFAIAKDCRECHSIEEISQYAREKDIELAAFEP